MDSKRFVQVISNGVKIVAAGAFHSMVLKEDGSIWATGSNKDGQFGDGSRTSQVVFVKIEPLYQGYARFIPGLVYLYNFIAVLI